MTARFRIVGTDLPGVTCGPAPTATGRYEQIHVGVQRGREVIDLVPGDAPRAVFEFDVVIKANRFAGPYVHGRDGARFIYLSWGELIDGQFDMFRRAKLHIDHLDAPHCDQSLVTGTLSLRDDLGHPLCASVRPPRIVWTRSVTT